MAIAVDTHTQSQARTTPSQGFGFGSNECHFLGKINRQWLEDASRWHPFKHDFFGAKVIVNTVFLRFAHQGKL
ncbi:MAG: hypothetical protein F6J90_01115 [Moorea sp. SIOASIH]|uniref:hypothetical protein n=1 Tax=Moorena sp. SIOASIH TaxID=2607817 RepID=UPI0013B8E3A9|nr:hypothetical protein [Moorena sp. SIOASIH]NEO34976.1 hypothetical protein [Moorena sp. SIOASIH]